MKQSLTCCEDLKLLEPPRFSTPVRELNCVIRYSTVVAFRNAYESSLIFNVVLIGAAGLLLCPCLQWVVVRKSQEARSVTNDENDRRLARLQTYAGLEYPDY